MMRSTYVSYVKRLPLVIILFSASIYSQGTTAPERILNYLEGSNKLEVLKINSGELKGNSYIQKTFQDAKFVNYNKIYPLRYNAYQDEMEINFDGKIYNLPKTENLEVEFIATNKIYKVFGFKENKSNKFGFFVVLYHGKNIFLLTKERIKFFKAVLPKTGYDEYNPPSLKHTDDEFYIGYKNNTADKLPKKKKEILKLFSSKAKKINHFVKINNLSFKNKGDLVKIFEYYNSLK